MDDIKRSSFLDSPDTLGSQTITRPFLTDLRTTKNNKTNTTVENFKQYSDFISVSPEIEHKEKLYGIIK